MRDVHAQIAGMRRQLTKDLERLSAYKDRMEGIKARLEALRDKIEEDRKHDVQWYRSMTVLHWINDVLDPPTNKDTRAVPEVPEEPQQARFRGDRRTKHDNG